MKNITSIILLLFSISLTGQQPNFKFGGLKIRVTNLDEAYSFYSDILGFKVERSLGELSVIDQRVPIVIERGKSVSENESPLGSGIGLAF